MSETRTILFLGASFAGVGTSHYFLRHEYPRLPKDSNVSYKVVVVDPSSKMFIRPVAPRVAAAPKLISTKQILLDTEPGYKQYGDLVSFIQGKAVAWDSTARTVQVQPVSGEAQTIHYWALVLATGTKSTSPIFSLQGNSHTETEEALLNMNKSISVARDIVIGGGGPCSVELAGELGEELNGAAGFCQSRPSKTKAKITVITSGSKLLPSLRQAISDTAESYLNRVGVDVRYNTKIASTTPLPDGGAHITLHDGEELDADVYVQAMGVTPMTDFVPSHLKDSKGYVVQNETTLRVDAAGPRVYAVGDIGTASNQSIIAIMDMVPVAATNLRRDLAAAQGGKSDAKPPGKDREYKKNEKETQIVPVGRSKGVGAVFGTRLPSIMVWLFKGKDYGISKAPDFASGNNYAKETTWKEK